MVNIFLITGCLGAGKTTFLQNTLNNIQGKKVGVLINEFGKVGIDGELISTESLHKVELNNGSIFCSCLKDHFIHGLADLIGSDLEYIFIESSGLSDPSNIYPIFKVLDKLIEKKYRYMGGICLIDSLYFDKQLDFFINVKRQLEQCSLAILNKTDLQSDENLRNIRKKISSINGDIAIEETSYGRLDFDRLLKFNTRDDVSSSESLNREDNKPSAYVLDILPENKRENLELFVRGLMKSCSRIKGIVRLKEGKFKIDSVMDSFYIEEVPEYPEKELVLLSSIGFKVIKEINNLSARHDISFRISS